jgi:hypothetical protein
VASISIRTGGQSGVDRAALDHAIQHGLPYGSWCPRGGWAEDYPTAPGVLAPYPRLSETPSRETLQRTAWNVRDSHATLILVRGDELLRSPGTVFTRQAAELLFLRPFLVVDIAHEEALEQARAWLSRVAAGLGAGELVLHVAGPRESEARGIHGDARRFLEALLA